MRLAHATLPPLPSSACLAPLSCRSSPRPPLRRTFRSSSSPRCSISPPPRPTSLDTLLQRVVASALALTIAFHPSPGPALPISLTTPVSVLQQQELLVEDLFRDATPSVVFINTFVERADRFTMNAVEVPAGAGSGFIWDDKGHVPAEEASSSAQVTNYHVIRNAKAAKVAVTDGGRTVMYDASLVGYNPDKDVAVLSIDVSKDSPVSTTLKPISLGDSSDLRVGQTTLAIGNPFGLDHSLTMGVVSGLGREVRSPSGRPITNVIQTDAAINPGNSGGALLDSRGKLIGMNTAIYSPSGASAGIGFAIPVDTLKQQVASLIKDGQVLRPVIGISYAQGAQARALGVQKGVLVLSVPKDSAADTSGLRATYRDEDGNLILGDVIVAVKDMDVKNDGDLFKALDKCSPGETVSLTVERPTSAGIQNGVFSQARERVQLKIELKATPAV